jgi:hypothetical protein
MELVFGAAELFLVLFLENLFFLREKLFKDPKESRILDLLVPLLAPREDSGSNDSVDHF